MPTNNPYFTGAPPPQAGPRFPGPPWLQKMQGGFNRFMNGMGPPANPMLSQDEQTQQLQRQRMAMAAALLSASGPRPQGTTGTMEAFGQAMQAGQAAGDQSTADAIRLRLAQAQFAQAQQGGQERADPNVIRALVMAGIDPKSEQGQGIVIKSLTGGDGAAAEQIALLNAQLTAQARQDQINRDKASDAKLTEEQRVAREQVGTTLIRGLEQTGELVNHTQNLQGSFLEAGMPASNWRRLAAPVMVGAGAAIGMDTTKLDSEIVEFDRLKKGLSDQLLGLISSGSLSRGTNMQLTQYQNSLANTDTSAGGILAIQANIAQTMLDEADIQKVEVPNRASIEANIKKWRAYEAPEGEPVIDARATAASAREIGQMTLEQLNELAGKAGELTEEMREAAAKRWDELNAR